MSEPLRNPSLDAALIDVVADWLMEQALADTPMTELVEGCCRRMRAAGVPLTRAMVGYRTLHPLFEAIWLTWHNGKGIGTYEMPHGATGTRVFRESPFFHMLDNEVPFLRRKLEGPDALFDFPVLKDFVDQGSTDYLAVHVNFSRPDIDREIADGMLMSWLTDRPGGFSEADVRAIRRIKTRLAVACKVRIKGEVSRNLLNAYLGNDPGDKVLGGHIQRGDTETVRAVIWYSDMRNSTRLAEDMAPGEYMAVLNDVFEATASPVIDNGGEVLLLIGDAVLALFPCQQMGTGRAAAAAAERSALQAIERLDALNVCRAGEGHQPVSCGIALHAGELTYGNIGVPQRLQFTAIGPAANQVARIEGLTKVLQRSLLGSAAFVELLEQPWQSLGSQALKGVPAPIEVFAPAGDGH
ncbi:MAG: adenylate/guanylate cyclase domain-containing protein [Rhodospirillales bacterium]|nr:adenylate/guanylate cyclase domain-containing protein [Rhodospirillales bacterium]